MKNLAGKLVFTTIAIAVLISPVANATSVEKCKLIVEPMSGAASGVRKMLGSIKSFDVRTALPQFSGAERQSLLDLEKVNAETVAALEKYAAQLEDTAYVMQKCAR